MAQSRIAELAATIAANTKQVDDFFASQGLPTPSFEPDSPSRALLDGRVAAPRQAILEATDELHALVLGPISTIMTQPFNFWISLHAIYRFGLATSFSAGQDETTFQEISRAAGLSESHVRRLLRHAMAYRIFQEPRKGVVRHTAASKALADNPLLRQWLGMVSEEIWPAMTKTVPALQQWPASEEPNNSGYNIAHQTDADVFEEVQKYPDREARYAQAMTWFSTGPGLEPMYVLNSFDWTSLSNGLVVDVGGSHGSLSIAIAQSFPTLRFIVQDKAEVVELGREMLPANVRDRVSFMSHDFFTEQPVKNADVYALRWILHDWSDKYAVRILQALIPALKPGARILVIEQVLPEPGTASRYQEKTFRSMDFAMWGLHNAKERDRDDWKSLFGHAHPNLQMVNIAKPVGSRLSIIEVKWQPQDT